jgi:outer membrane protein assembly factor BamB
MRKVKMTNNVIPGPAAGSLRAGWLPLLALLFAPLLWAQQKTDPAGAQVSAAPLWEQDIGDAVTGSPYVQVNSAVLVCDGGSVKSYFMSGSALWSFDPRDRVVPVIARSIEGVSYVCNAAGDFMAINRVGRELWRINLGKPVSFAPVVGWDGRVFIPAEAGLSCRTASGRALWSQDLGSPMALAPVLDHGGGVATVLRNQDFVKINQFSAIERIRLDRVPSLIVPLKDGDQQSYALLYASGETEKIAVNDSAPAGKSSPAPVLRPFRRRRWPRRTTITGSP